MDYKDLPANETPSSRIREIGPSSLTDSELFAIAIGLSDSETAQRIAGYYHEVRSLGAMERSQVCALLTGPQPKSAHRASAKADVLAAIFELARRDQRNAVDDRPAIHSPADAAALVQYEMAALEQEELRVLLLDTRNRLIRIVTLYKGSLNCSMVRICEVFKDAIRANAAALIVLHNHPSGDPTPSPEDVNLTRSLVQAGKLMDISVLDHLVIGLGRYVSLKEKGLGFSA